MGQFLIFFYIIILIMIVPRQLVEKVKLVVFDMDLTILKVHTGGFALIKKYNATRHKYIIEIDIQ